jgi:peptidoglycan/LPS O-acetylase OafA/YrhL
MPLKRAGVARVSKTGLGGALLGFLPLFALGVTTAANPPEAGLGIPALLLAMAAVYVPAIWVSLVPIPARWVALLGVAAVSLLLVLVFSVALPSVFGPASGLLLLPATVLLFAAAGLAFERSRDRATG